MATVQIGRATVDADCAWLAKVTEQTDQERTLSGTLAGATLEQTNVARTNLRSIPPGTVIPITHSGDPKVDGFYELVEAAVGYSEGGVAGTGAVPWTLRGRYLGSHPEVFWQSRFSGVNRDAAAVRFHAVPSTTALYTPEPAGGIITRTLADGNSIPVALGIAVADRPVWENQPGSHYRGAATVKWANTAGGTRYTREGLWIPPGLPDEWEISNGLIRLTPNAGGTFGFILAAWNAASWTTWDFTVIYAGASATTLPLDSSTRPAVLANSPELAVVRFEQTRGAAVGGRWHLTLALRRGSRFVHLRWGRTGATSQLGLRRTDPDPATSATDYIYDTTAGTVAWLAGSTATYTEDLDQGGFYLTTAALQIDAFAGTRNGTGTGENFDDIRNQWYGELSEASWPRGRGAA